MKNENEILRDVLSDEDFLESVIKMDMESARKAFKERGIELSTDDMIKIKNTVQEQLKNPEAISDQLLEQISGGGMSLAEAIRNMIHLFYGEKTANQIKDITYAISAIIIAYQVGRVCYKAGKAADAIQQAAANINPANFWNKNNKKTK